MRLKKKSVLVDALATLAPILAAFALVLAIACANVANMMLARGLARLTRTLILRSKTDATVAAFVSDVIYVSVLVFAVVSALGWVLGTRRV